MATLSFGGVAMVKTNPIFVDQCLMVAYMGERLEALPWKDGHADRKFGRLTVHIGPDRELQSLHATVAWRNEVLAYLFPVS